MEQGGPPPRPDAIAQAQNIKYGANMTCVKKSYSRRWNYTDWTSQVLHSFSSGWWGSVTLSALQSHAIKFHWLTPTLSPTILATLRHLKPHATELGARSREQENPPLPEAPQPQQSLIPRALIRTWSPPSPLAGFFIASLATVILNTKRKAVCHQINFKKVKRPHFFHPKATEAGWTHAYNTQLQEELDFQVSLLFGTLWLALPM